MSFPFRKTLLATALAVASSAAFAGALVNDGLDGAWAVPTDSARGALFDVLPREDGSSDVYGAVYTYDEEGAPLWLVFLANFQPGESAREGIEVARYHGGSFGYPSEVATEEMVGTASLDLNGPGSISLALNLDGLPEVVLDLQPAHRIFPGYIAPAATAAASLSACPTGTTAQGNDCVLPNGINGDLILPAGKTYVIHGEVSVNAGGTLTIAPGVTLKGHSNTDQLNYLIVQRGGRIYAEGTATQPIVFTGPEPVIGSWGGVAIAGYSTCNDGPDTEACGFEANLDIKYGGTDLHDNSGVLKYVRIEYAGIQIEPGKEFNSLTLLGVGDGTTIEYVQVDSGKDDGIEFFGGSVNVRHAICSNMGDDCFDFDQGYSGKIQFALAWPGSNPDITGAGDTNGIESDNDVAAGDHDRQPRTLPHVSNMTLVGSTTETNQLNAIRIRRGSGGIYTNVVAVGYDQYSLKIDDPVTQGLGADLLSFTYSFFGPSAAGTIHSGAQAQYANWGSTNEQGDPRLDGFLPEADSPVLTGGQSLSDPWFRPTTYRGAFAGKHDDWTAGWTVRLPH